MGVCTRWHEVLECSFPDTLWMPIENTCFVTHSIHSNEFSIRIYTVAWQHITVHQCPRPDTSTIYRQNHIKFIGSFFTNVNSPTKLIELRADIDAIASRPECADYITMGMSSAIICQIFILFFFFLVSYPSGVRIYRANREK